MLRIEAGHPAPVWRAACLGETDDANAVAPVCDDEGHDPQDPAVYSCCPDVVIETGSAVLALYVAELLNADHRRGDAS